jgi:hypothetical protein
MSGSCTIFGTEVGAVYPEKSWDIRISILRMRGRPMDSIGPRYLRYSGCAASHCTTDSLFCGDWKFKKAWPVRSRIHRYNLPLVERKIDICS